MSVVPLSQRVLMARRYAGLTRAELAERVTTIYGGEFTETQVAAIELGTAPYSRRLVDIAVACGVEIEWLGLGEGSMTKGGAASETLLRAPAQQREEARLVLAFRMLPPDARAAILLVTEQLALPMFEGYRAFEQSMQDGIARRA